MNKIAWDFVVPMVDPNAILDFEKKYSVRIPDDLKQCIQNNNAGMPDMNVYDTNTTNGRTFKELLSFNIDDTDNVYAFLDNFKENGKLIIIPFALDEFGNFICVDNGEIALWLHETGEKEFIADSFTEFLNMLHK